MHINSSLKLLSDHGMKSLNQIYIDLTYKTQVHNIDDQNTNVAETAHEALPLRTYKHFNDVNQKARNDENKFYPI